MAGCTDQVATVVTRISCRVVAEVNRDPSVSVMTAVTLQSGDKVVAGLASGGRAVVAARTGAGDAVMVKAGRNPGAC
jgi:hypothetical protein